MQGWIWLFPLIGSFAGFVLYRRGIAVTKSIQAISFVFLPGRGADKAILDTCTGWVRHIGRFGESRTYTFFLDDHLLRGSAEVLLLDGKKQPLLKLNRQSLAGRVDLNRKNRYFLRWEWKGATGRCALHWERK